MVGASKKYKFLHVQAESATPLPSQHIHDLPLASETARAAPHLGSSDRVLLLGTFMHDPEITIC